MHPWGGFRHNAQVLRVVDQLERRHPDFPGLNLTRELRESLLKHETDEDWPDEFRPKPRQPLLEGQVVDLADSTAYNKHDIEDGLAAGMFTEATLEEGVELWRVAETTGRGTSPRLPRRRRRSAPAHRPTRERGDRDLHRRPLPRDAPQPADTGVSSVAEVRAHETMLCAHSPELKPLVAELQRFLYREFYRHPYLKAFRHWARDVIGALFDAYREAPSEMSDWVRALGRRGRARAGGL